MPPRGRQLRPSLRPQYCTLPGIPAWRRRVQSCEAGDEAGWCGDAGKGSPCLEARRGDADAPAWRSFGPDRSCPPTPGNRHDGVLRQGGRAAAEADRPTLAGSAAMIAAVERYLTLRRAAGFNLSNSGYLLASFARFAAERHQAHVRAETAIAWAAQGPSVAQRHERLNTVCRFARFARAEDERHEVPPANYF